MRLRIVFPKKHQLMRSTPIVSRCTGRVPVPSDPNVPWTPELLAQLFAPERRAVWGEVVALTMDKLNFETSTEQNGIANGQ